MLPMASFCQKFAFICLLIMTVSCGTESSISSLASNESCQLPLWKQGAQYAVGSKVIFQGRAYVATNANPGYDPTISTWFWSPTSCGGVANGNANQASQKKSSQPQQHAPRSSFSSILSEAQFNQLFPGRNPFYTYQGLMEAADATAGFAKEGSLEDRKREVAAVLANAEHESDHFKATREYNTNAWPYYCQAHHQFPCANGQQYYGRGPIQLSWNYNYGAAGQALGVDLLNNPDLVATNPKIAWQTMMWYWMTQRGPGTMTPHQAIIQYQSFGETIRSINGALECNGRNPAQVAARIQYYQRILQVLGVSAGAGNISC